MSVVTDSVRDITRDAGKPCAVCGERLRYPFLSWHYSEIRICVACCKEIKNGLSADLVHAAAICELRKTGYQRDTLIRSTDAEEERKSTKEREAQEQSIRKKD